MRQKSLAQGSVYFKAGMPPDPLTKRPLRARHFALVCRQKSAVASSVSCSLSRFRLLSNYVVWQMIRDKISLLSSEFRKARAWFNEKVSGVTKTEDRWRTCTSVTNSNMGVPIGTKYVRSYFNEETRHKVGAVHLKRFWTRWKQY